MSTPEAPADWAAPPHVLDDLDLLRRGVIDAVPEPVTSRAPVAVVDPEGAPVVVVDASGRATWTGRSSARPFEALHVAPAQVAAHGAVVLIDAGTEPATVEAAVADADAPLVIATDPVEADGVVDEAAVAVVRRAVALAGRERVVAAPVARTHQERAERLAAIGAAYSDGAAIVDLTSESADRPIDGGTVLFFTGLSGSGKSTLARAVRNKLLEASDVRLSVLDGDIVRRNLSAGLGFSVEDRDRNVRRIGWVAAELAHHGGLVIASPIAPFDGTRRDVAAQVAARGGRFVLIHVSTPLAECERRDRKGLYAKARRGEIPEFTGISSPYEVPVDPDVRVDTTGKDVGDLADQLIATLRERGAL